MIDLNDSWNMPHQLTQSSEFLIYCHRQ